MSEPPGQAPPGTTEAGTLRFPATNSLSPARSMFPGYPVTGIPRLGVSGAGPACRTSTSAGPAALNWNTASAGPPDTHTLPAASAAAPWYVLETSVGVGVSVDASTWTTDCSKMPDVVA